MSKRSTQKPSQEEATDPQQLEGLMAPDKELVDLDTTAWDAAEEWIADNDELKRESDQHAAAEPTQEATAEEPTSEARTAVSTVDRVLQIMLVVNLVLLAVMLIVPSGGNKPSDPTPARTGTAATTTEKAPDSFVQPPRVIGALPNSGLWEESVRAAGEGDYRGAAAVLQRYLATSNGMTDLERRLVYNQLAFYLTKDGRIAEAHEYERKSQQLMARSYLPDDLLNSARRAAQQGQIAAMRSAYARLLLQQKQIPPTLRKSIAEAYLKLGDSYRLEANRAESATRDQQEREK